MSARDRSETPALLRVLAGERLDPPPIWIMRQAGRYLPEYRELRGRANSFLEFCYSPALAAEAALQPLRRFDLDAAILFSDILTIPDALGRAVDFVEGEGPRLRPLVEEEDWRFDDPAHAVLRLSAVYEAAERTKRALPRGIALIGFCGGPWTVATYMLQGQGGDKERARRAAYERPEDVARLIDILVETSAHHLAKQAGAGADCLQIFESWAEGLAEPLFWRLVIEPTRKLVDRLRALGCEAPVIGFPRGAGALIGAYAHETGLDGLGVDTQTPASFARAHAPKGMALQGNLDPQALVAGGEALTRAAREVSAAFRGGPHIFNLGHGVTPDARVEEVERLVRLVKGGA